MEGLPAEPPVSVAPYAVLEIDPGASPSEVRTAYKKLALRYHPGPYPLIPFHYLFSRHPLTCPLFVFQTKRSPPLKPLRMRNSKKLPSPMPSSPTLPAARVMTPLVPLPNRPPALTVTSIGPTSSDNSMPMLLPWTGSRS